MVFSSYIKTQVKTLSCIISVAMTLGSIILISEDKEKAIIVDNSLEYIADLTLRRETILFFMKGEIVMKVLKYLSSLCALSILLSVTSPVVINATEDEEKGNQLMPEELIIDEKINEAFENGSDNVPAVIWYDPINQTDVDNEVFERTGLTIENIDIPYIQPPMDLLAELDKEANDEKSDTLSTLMSSYLNDTKEARRIEKELSDKYSNERREVIKELNLKNLKMLFRKLA